MDALDNADVTGFTYSTNFPTMAGAFQPTFSGGGVDAFVTKFNPIGSTLYSTYLGGYSLDYGLRIAVDAAGDAYVTGFTISGNFPTTAGAFQPTFGGSYEAFVAKITEAVPPPSVGRVTGGGTINIPGGTANFGFVVQAQSTTGPIVGSLQYVNQASGARLHSVTFDSLVIAGNSATFGGTCTNNGAPCTFTAKVQDNGATGTNDSFAITVDAGPPEGANENLRIGNVLIH